MHTTDPHTHHIGILGAGAVGGYIGGCLAAGAQTRVTLVGRPALVDALNAEGLRLSSLLAPPRHLPLGPPPYNLQATTDPAALAACHTVLLCTKGRDTAAAAASLRPHLSPGTTVVSLQNGVRNAERIRAALPDPRLSVLRGMVAFNVVWSDNHFHQTTSGPLLLDVDPSAPALCEALRAGGISASTHPDMQGVLWGKLLFNLNNALNALSGLPLRAQLEQRAYRRLLAALIGEAQAVLRGAGIQPRPLGRMNPTLARWVLPLPDLLFARVAHAMLQVDAEARSSMQDDLRRGRTTEVDDINGEITALGRAPLNAGVVALVKQAEATGNGPPGLSAAAIQDALRQMA